MPQVPQVPSAAKKWDVQRGSGTPFAVVQGPQRRGFMSGDSRDFDQVDKVKQAVSGDFLWFRKGGKAYIVQDAAVLARLGDAHAPVERISAQMKHYGKEMEQHSKAIEALGKEMERLAGKAESERMASLSKQMDQASKPMDALSRKMDVLGKELDRQVMVAERLMQKVIADTMKLGMARVL